MGLFDSIKGLLPGMKTRPDQPIQETPITGEAPAPASAVQEKLKALIEETEGFAGRVRDVMAQPGTPVEATPAATVAPAAPVEAAAPVANAAPTLTIAPAPLPTPSAGVLAEAAPVTAPEAVAPVATPMPVDAALGTPTVMPAPTNEVKMPEAPTVQENEGAQAA